MVNPVTLRPAMEAAIDDYASKHPEWGADKEAALKKALEGLNLDKAYTDTFKQWKIQNPDAANTKTATQGQTTLPGGIPLGVNVPASQNIGGTFTDSNGNDWTIGSNASVYTEWVGGRRKRIPLLL